MVFTGAAMVPAFVSCPVTSSTKIASAIVPSMPSQFESTNMRSGLSVVPPSLHSHPPIGGGGVRLVSCENVPLANWRCTKPESHVHEHATAPASPPMVDVAQFVIALGTVAHG